MSFSTTLPPPPAEDGWGSSPITAIPPGQEVQAALKKEEQIRDIIALQTSLKGLIDKIDTSQANVDKLGNENEMLKTYIENLTRSNAGGAVGPGKR